MSIALVSISFKLGPDHKGPWGISSTLGQNFSILLLLAIAQHKSAARLLNTTYTEEVSGGYEALCSFAFLSALSGPEDE